MGAEDINGIKLAYFILKQSFIYPTIKRLDKIYPILIYLLRNEKN